MLLSTTCRPWLLAVLTVAGAGLAVDEREGKKPISWSAQQAADMLRWQECDSEPHAS